MGAEMVKNFKLSIPFPQQIDHTRNNDKEKAESSRKTIEDEKSSMYYLNDN
jgi:hypothetical protein